MPAPPATLLPYFCTKTVVMKDSLATTVLAQLQALITAGLPVTASINIGTNTMTAAWIQT